MLTSLSPYIGQIIFALVLVELIWAVYLDLLSGKFPNKYFLAYLGLNLFLVVFLRGGAGIWVGAMTLGVAALLLVPIYYVKILGGGDIKLILATSPLLLLDEFVAFLLLSFVWAGLFGLFRSLLGGNIRALLTNTLMAGRKITVAEDGIPFTVGIFLAWCSYHSILSMGLI